MARKKGRAKAQSCQDKNVKSYKRLIDTKLFVKTVISNLYGISRHEYTIFEKNL